MASETIYCTKEIAKLVRKELKDKFPDLTISVTKESYSGGSSIHLSIMKSTKTKFVMAYDDISQDTIDQEVLRDG
jgi:hypothetical protein